MKKRLFKELARRWPKGYEDGVGVVEMVLILVVLLGLVVIFRAQLTLMVRNIFASLTETVNGII